MGSGTEMKCPGFTRGRRGGNGSDANSCLYGRDTVLSYPRCGINGGRAVFYMQDGFGAVPYVLGKYPPCNGKAAE